MKDPLAELARTYREAQAAWIQVQQGRDAEARHASLSHEAMGLAKLFGWDTPARLQQAIDDNEQGLKDAVEVVLPWEVDDSA